MTCRPRTAAPWASSTGRPSSTCRAAGWTGRPPCASSPKDSSRRPSRGRVASFPGADPQTTIFTKNVTEAITLAAYSWGRAHVGPGDAVLITQMEHHANIVPWQVLCRERRAELRYLEVDERGELSL